MSLELSGPEFIAPQTKTVERIVIFLHGYGADGEDLISLAQPLSPIFPNTAFYSPDAPFVCEMAPQRRQWFSLAQYDPNMLRREPETMEPALQAMHKGASEVAPILQTFISKLMKKHDVSADKVMLVGFSQGTMMALHCAYRRDDELAGVLGFSGALLGADVFAAEKTSNPPARLVHGDADPVVPVEATVAAHKVLEEAGVEVDKFIVQNLQHGIDQNGLQLAANFIGVRFGLVEAQ